MKTYQDIISEADERYPNALTAVSKMRKIYNRERELFRTIYRKKTATAYDMVTDQFLYPLDFHQSKIISVIVDGTRYEYEDINNGSSEPPYIYTYEDSIGIYPTPDEDITGGLFIHHYYEPPEPSATTDLFKFDNDFPMVLVYSLCVELAEIAQDAAMVNNFTAKYNGAIEEFVKSLPEPELEPIRVE